VAAQWNGISFTLGTVLGPVSDLYSVSLTSPSDGWAVGGLGSSPLILHYSGGAWTQVAAPQGGYVLRSVFMVNSGEGWAVGDGGRILHLSGSSWGIVSSPVTNTLRSLFMVGQNDGWAAGDGGTILRYQGSGQWVKIAGPTSADLRSVYFLDSTHGWIVGSSGTILHFDGTSWAKVSAFTTANLFSVIQVSSAEAWAVGDSGTIIHWNGVAWYPYTPTPPLTGNPTLNSIFLLSSGYGLIVGSPPAPGSQATVLLVNQQAITQVPELTNTAVVLLLILLAPLVFMKRKGRGYFGMKMRSSRDRRRIRMT